MDSYATYYCIIGELPVTIDVNPYDRAPGNHNITIVANSALGEMADFTNTFLFQVLYDTSMIYNKSR